MSETNTATAVEQPDPESRFWGSYDRGTFGVWSAVFYMIAATTLYDTYVDNPAALRGWRLAGLLVLLAGYFVLYHWFFADGGANMPLRRILLYGSLQFVIVVLLATFNSSFVSLLYAVLAHLLATLPYRRWPLPMGMALLVVYFFWGVHNNLLAGNWDDAFFTMLQPVTWLIIIASLIIVTRKTYEQTRTVRELRRARAQLEASAAQAEELAVLRERARLAREMHDSIGHALVVVNVKLEAAQRLYQRDLTRGDAELEATRELVRQTMSELRSSLANLRAPVTAHHDLPAALRALAAESTVRSGLHIDVEIPPELPILDPQVAEALWRVAREALANVERHAGAASATIGLARSGDALVLRIADDGVGISAADRRKVGHYGLVGMNERIAALGGSLSVDGSSGGTVVEARLPLPANASRAERAVGAEHAQDASHAEHRQNTARAADT